MKLLWSNAKRAFDALTQWTAASDGAGLATKRSIRGERSFVVWECREISLLLLMPRGKCNFRLRLAKENNGVLNAFPSHYIATAHATTSLLLNKKTSPKRIITPALKVWIEFNTQLILAFHKRGPGFPFYILTSYFHNFHTTRVFRSLNSVN